MSINVHKFMYDLAHILYNIFDIIKYKFCSMKMNFFER